MRQDEKKFRMNKLNRIGPGWNLAITILLGIVALTVVIPLILVVIISFSSKQSISEQGYSFFPSEWSMEAYRSLFKTGSQIFDSLVVTITHTVLGTLLSLLFMSLYAYVLAQPNFPFKKFYTYFIFITMLFSGGLVPSYIINTQYLKLYDSFWVLIWPGLISSYNIIILRTFIQSTIPTSLFEAARIDGANDLTIYFQIVLPLFKAGLATVGLFNVVGRWNDWFTGMLYIESAKLIPLQTMLTKIQANIEFIRKNSSAITGPDGLALLRAMPEESFRMAAVVVTVVPILFAYPFFQRYFVQGIMIGSVKG